MRIDHLTKQGPGRPPNHVVRLHTSFHYRAKSWSKARRIVAKVEFHPGEPIPTVGFIVTNRSLPNGRVPASCQGRGSAEQHLLAHAGMRCQATHQGGRIRARMDAALLHEVRGERRAAATPRLGLQPRQLPADSGDTRTERALVPDIPARTPDQNRGTTGAPWPLRHVPDGCSRTAASGPRGHPSPDQHLARAAGQDPEDASAATGQVRPTPEETVPKPVGAARLAAPHLRFPPFHRHSRRKMLGHSIQVAVTSRESGQMGYVGL